MISAFLSYRVCTRKNTYSFRKAHFIFNLKNVQHLIASAKYRILKTIQSEHEVFNWIMLHMQCLT